MLVGIPKTTSFLEEARHVTKSTLVFVDGGAVITLSVIWNISSGANTKRKHYLIVCVCLGFVL